MTALISEAEKQGDYAVAAEDYLAQAAESEGALKSAFQYRAAMMQYELGELAEADALLAETNLEQLSPREQLTANLLRADIALLNLDGQQALTHLDKIDFDSANEVQQKRILELRITAYDLTENSLEKALAHIKLDPMAGLLWRMPLKPMKIILKQWRSPLKTGNTAIQITQLILNN